MIELEIKCEDEYVSFWVVNNVVTMQDCAIKSWIDENTPKTTFKYFTEKSKDIVEFVFASASDEALYLLRWA